MSGTEYFPQDQIIAQITSEFTSFLAQYDESMAKERLPPISKTRDTSNGDYTVLLKGACAKRKIDVEKYTQDLVVALNKHFEDNKNGFLQRAEALRGFINLYVNRTRVFSYATEVGPLSLSLLYSLLIAVENSLLRICSSDCVGIGRQVW